MPADSILYNALFFYKDQAYNNIFQALQAVTTLPLFIVPSSRLTTIFKAK